MKRRGATYRLLFGEVEGERISQAQSLAVRAGTMLQTAIKKLAPGAEYQARLQDPARHQVLRADIVTGDLAVELKLGFEFDTKKAAREVEDIKNFARLLSVREQKEITPAICLFQAISAEDMKGFKADISGVRMLNGHDLCGLLNIDYNIVLESVQAMARGGGA